MCQCQTHRRGRWLWWQRGAQVPGDLEDDEEDDEEEEEEEEEEEAKVAFAVLLEQGKEVAAEASRASSSI